MPETTTTTEATPASEPASTTAAAPPSDDDGVDASGDGGDTGEAGGSGFEEGSDQSDKTQAPDAYHRVMFTYPCAAGEDVATDQGTCLVNIENDEWQLIPR